MGGSADLAGSNNTTPAGRPSFLPAHRSTDDFQGHEGGRVLHFGVREHAMGSILNGIALHGLTRPYGGTFLVFSDYMRPAVRLAGLMRLPVTYVWTHDSIGLGEDGPTHQPVEHLTALRAIPNLDVVRPADGNETSYAWAEIQRRASLPGTLTALALSRQGLPVLDGTSADGVARGGYVLADSAGEPDALVLATGSQVHLAVAAKDALAGEVAVRVVSMPSQEWFAAQDPAYRDAVLPPHVTEEDDHECRDRTLSAQGVAIWLDDLSRARLDTGTLAAMIDEQHVVGVTTNPSIFQAAITGSDDYAADVDRLRDDGADVQQIVRALTTDDVRRACELFLPVWASTGVKNPAYSPTLYVTELVAPGTVDTMPDATLTAVTAESEPVTGDTVTGSLDQARTTLHALAELGIDLDQVTAVLEDESVAKFEQAWTELLATVEVVRVP